MKFTIRDLLWLTLLAAVLVAWFLQHRRMTAERKRLDQERGTWRLRAESLKADLERDLGTKFEWGEASGK